jgi:hypothetical protein
MLPSSILFVTLIIRNSHLQMEGSGAEHHREVFNIRRIIEDDTDAKKGGRSFCRQSTSRIYTSRMVTDGLGHPLLVCTRLLLAGTDKAFSESQEIDVQMNVPGLYQRGRSSENEGLTILRYLKSGPFRTLFHRRCS